jgi:hypothetical protein
LSHFDAKKQVPVPSARLFVWGDSLDEAGHAVVADLLQEPS